MTVIALVFVATLIARGDEKFRAPAIPLITHDPYLSLWEMSDRLTDDWPKHWTGATQALCGLVRVLRLESSLLLSMPTSDLLLALERMATANEITVRQVTNAVEAVITAATYR